MPKIKYTFKELVEFMQKDVFKDNLGVFKTGIVIKRLAKKQTGGIRVQYEDYNCKIYRIYLNYDIVLDVEEYDSTCKIFDMKKDKTIRKLSLRNAFIFLQNFAEKIEDMKLFGDSWEVVMEFIKDSDIKKAKKDNLYCEKHGKAFICGGNMLFYCPDCEKEITGFTLIK
jgi:hypothetical protein